MSCIILTKEGHEIIVDDEDYDELTQFEWKAVQRGKRSKYYAGRRVDAIRPNGMPYRKILMMHRYILDAPKGIHVHHINGNGLDNRKDNLQLIEQNEHFQLHRQNNIDKSWMIGKTTPIKDEIIIGLKLVLNRVKRVTIRKYEPLATYRYIPPEPELKDLPHWTQDPKLELF